MTRDIWFGQFNIVGGVTTEEGPFVGIFEGTGSADGVGIYAVAEPIGAATPELCDRVLETIAAAFGRPEPALTVNLLRAVAAAHQLVRDWNRLHGTERLAGVALSCLATRGDEGYLAQCGPALALARTGGRFRVAAPAGDDSRRPLGLGERAAPVFTRFTLLPGDVLILTWHAADHLLDRGTLSSLVQAPPEEAMPALFVRVRTAGSFGALYLTVLERIPAMAPAPNGVVTTLEPAGTLHPVRRLEVLAPSTVRTSARNGRLPELPDSSLATVPPDRAPATRRVPLGALGDRSRLPSRRFLTIAAATLVAALLIWLATPTLARRGKDDRYQLLLRSADTSLAAAQTEPDLARRRELLVRAEADLLEARALRPDGEGVAARLDQVSDALAALDGTRELTDIVQVADLSTLGVAPQSPLELAIAGRVYLLDSGGGKVLAFDGPANRPETVFEEGRAIGAERTGKARHITVAPGGPAKPPLLLVLDANRRLYALDSSGWRPVPLSGADVWKADTAIAVTASALYVLDAVAEQVWRHLGTPDGYDGRPEPLVSRAALRDGTGLSISGVPIIATTDSRLLRIVDGKGEEWKPAALDRPLKAPSAPVYSSADALLYIADRGNQRIVILDAAGNYKGQMISRRLTALRTFALDEARGVLYAVSGPNVLRAPLPK